MINDTIDILPAKIVNFGIEYSIIGDVRVNKYDVLSQVNSTLRRLFNKTFDIGEPLLITDIAKTINNIRGVTDVINVKVTNKFTSGYSDVRYDTLEATPADGRMLLVPPDHILEMRRPEQDIVGTIK